jgi:hypothetical protein
MMLQHLRDSKGFLNKINNITATNYYKKININQPTNQPTNQSTNQPTNQMSDTNLQQELHV